MTGLAMRNTENPKKEQVSRVSRRDFMGAATTAVAAFTVVPRHVLGGAQHVAPSEKLNIAGIGIGGRGEGDLHECGSENIVALCDVDEAYAGKVFAKYPKARKWTDFRKMLDEQKDIDAVIIATPDHTHAVISMAAIKRGKHVYCEKPLAHSIWEARQVTEAARAAGVATQLGNQGQASEANSSGTAPLAPCTRYTPGAIGTFRHGVSAGPRKRHRCRGR